jgi:hypothetical protein
MSNKDQLQAMTDALKQIRLAEQALDDLHEKTAGSDAHMAISAVYRQLNNVAQSIIQARTIADDNVFKQVTADMKGQANALKASEKSIKKIINDAKIAGAILGYIAQAATIILTKL